MFLAWFLSCGLLPVTPAAIAFGYQLGVTVIWPWSPLPRCRTLPCHTTICFSICPTGPARSVLIPPSLQGFFGVIVMRDRRELGVNEQQTAIVNTATSLHSSTHHRHVIILQWMVLHLISPLFKPDLVKMLFPQWKLCPTDPHSLGVKDSAASAHWA